MPSQVYEYKVEPMSLAPDELRNERYKFEDTLNDAAGKGWVLDSTLRINSSTFMFVFRRSVDDAD